MNIRRSYQHTRLSASRKGRAVDSNGDANLRLRPEPLGEARCERASNVSHDEDGQGKCRGQTAQDADKRVGPSGRGADRHEFVAPLTSRERDRLRFGARPRTEAQVGFDRLRTVASFANDLKLAVRFKNVDQTLAYRQRIVNDQDTDHFWLPQPMSVRMRWSNRP